MTAEYISGYLDAWSRIKDILTPHVGGQNSFFSIPKIQEKDAKQNLQEFIQANRNHYSIDDAVFQQKLEKIELLEIADWDTYLKQTLSVWSCDSELISIHGKNGHTLTEYLVDFLLKTFFAHQNVKLYKMLPHWEYWHWGDHMSDDYLFETDTQLFVMHLGESS